MSFALPAPTSSSPATPESISPDVLVDEEAVPGYDRRPFYPAHPGQVVDDRYELKAKIGWGSSSTVWLTEDIGWNSWLRPGKYAALKISTCDDAGDEGGSHEWEMAKRIASANSEHRGRSILCRANEAFSIQSPLGTSHLCLAFEPLREPLWLYRRRLCGGDRVTSYWLPLFKVCIQILLEGLDYLHSECKIVHTDLKLDNIMMTFEDESVIEAFVKGQNEHPMARKVVGDRIVYRCHNNFGDVAGRPALKKMYPKITNFGLAQSADVPGLLLHPIQPDHCRAPEVLLGTSWSYPADVWNFGIIIWNLLGGCQLFQDGVGGTRPYDPAQHLAEMISILGPVPAALVRRERERRHWRWDDVGIRSAEGKLCGSAAEYFNGPFFTDEGEFVGKDTIPSSRSLTDEVPRCIPEQETERFLAFMGRMLCWFPEERATAKELKEDPWFDTKL